MKTSNSKKPIRSYALRANRLSENQEQRFTDLWKKYGVNFQQQLLDFKTIFPNSSEVIVDIGFGDGAALIHQAQLFPQQNFLGIEVHRPGIYKLMQSCEELKINNIRIIHHDANEVLQQMIPQHSLAGVQLLFPDPWPKRKHHKRRLLQTDFLKLVHSRLIAGGYLHCATDWKHYAQEIIKLFAGNTNWKNRAATGDFVARPEYRPLTKYETRGIKERRQVFDICFEKL